MTAVGIIPARYASTRFPGKVLAPIHGYPMVHHVYQRALQCRTLDEVLIAADSPDVADTCAALGDRVILTRTDHVSGTDRVAEAVRDMEFDLVVNIQGDEPQLDASVVDQLVTHMQAQSDLPMGTAGSTVLSREDMANPHIVKVIGRDGMATAFYRLLPAPVPEGVILRHIGLYAFRREFLFRFTAQPPSQWEQENRLEQLRALEMGASIGLVKTDYVSMAVDTPEDLERIVENWSE
ncbi:MAG: 3-deoxy-manno-octulosonate cytidylyltransferase [Fidelibacterota bacterium]|nr:MAG: 3-deoxy-manno-octulosonate cytidylyltransferase [Candidatus Neomarinimicrobiota bacterium]